MAIKSEKNAALIPDSPVETKSEKEQRTLRDDEPPYARANIFNIITSWWIGDLLKKIYRGEFEPERDLWKCAERDKADFVSQRLEKSWKQEVDKIGRQNASLFRVIWRSEKNSLVPIVLSYIAEAALVFWTSTYCVNNLLKFSSGEGPQDTVRGMILAMTLILASFAQLIISVGGTTFSTFVEARVRSGIMALLYNKVLKLNSLEDGDAAMITNVLLNDGDRIQLGLQGFAIVACPIVFLSSMIYSVQQAGLLVLVGYGIFLILGIVQLASGGLLATERRKCVGFADLRIRTINEILSNMKIIKIFAWEERFHGNVLEIRRKEERHLRRQLTLASANFNFAGFALIVTAVASILALIFSKESVTAVEAYTVLSTVISLRNVIYVLPPCVKQLAEFCVALARVKEVLLMEEFHPPAKLDQVQDTEQFCVLFNDASFAHKNSKMAKTKIPTCEFHEKYAGKTCYGSVHRIDRSQNSSEKDTNTDVHKDHGLPGLKNLKFGIEKSKLLGICGSVGVGKSSFLHAIAGRLKLSWGDFAVSGTIAWAPQEAFILNATVRENIVFDNNFDQERYDRVLECCCLLEDIGRLPGGDATEIGERGINLSGGQKQRVSLARAVYSDRDVYLLDDPLSAVDTKVASTIFKKCIKEKLKGKTVLLVSHQVRFFSHCDLIIYLTKSGIVTDHTHVEMVHTDAEYRKMIKSVGREEEQRQKAQKGYYETIFDTYQEKKTSEYHISQTSCSGRLTVTERVDGGRASWRTIRAYRTAGGTVPYLGLGILTLLLGCCQQLPIWLVAVRIDSNDYNRDNRTATLRGSDENLTSFLIVFSSTPVIHLILILIKCLLFAWVSVKASGFFHNKLLQRIIRATMTFFDTTPVGRMQNLFSADQDKVDNQLPLFLDDFVRLATGFLLMLIAIAVASPLVLVMLVLCGLLLVRIWKMSITGMRELRRLQNVAKSPLCSSITSTTLGLFSIVAYDKQRKFVKDFYDLLDRYTILAVCSNISNKWMACRLEALCWLIICAVSIVIAVSPTSQTAAQAGLALIYANQMYHIVTFLLHNANMLQAHLTSVEKLDNYIKDVPQELPTVVDDYRPHPIWPAFGKIQFRDFCLRYQPHSPRILHNISFSVKAKEKVGIVGRTGAGKSSLMVALFRLVEKESGEIFIDGLDISKLGLDDLRSKMSLIPQDPVLFAGTIRSNLDTLKLHSDSQLWEVLVRCHIDTKISSLPGRLDHVVVDGGSNFSVGEKQLLCLARTLLCKSRIFLLDEATASVDPQTDALIQDTIRTAFPDCTMLVIAHRLNTVLDCDKILVMDGGRVAEYDTPDRLLNCDSFFKRLLLASKN